jgi:hypothetical protein
MPTVWNISAERSCMYSLEVMFYWGIQAPKLPERQESLMALGSKSKPGVARKNFCAVQKW